MTRTRRSLRCADAPPTGELLATHNGLTHPTPPPQAEFLISVLLEHEIVDETTLSAIRQQFRHICRRSPDADPLLDAKLVFEELVHTGQVLQTRGRHSIMNNGGGGENGGAAANDSPSKVAADAVKDAVAAAAVKEIENADGHHFKGHDGTMGRVSETQRLLHGPASSSPRSSSRYTGWSWAAKGAPRVDLTADDGGFGEWFDKHWAPKVAERAALRNTGRLTPRSN